MNTNDLLRRHFLVVSTATLMLVLGCAGTLGTRPHANSYAVEARVTIGGSGGWDFITLDQFRQRLFIPRGDRVQVWSIDSKKVISEIEGTAGVHGVALAQDLKRGFTSNGRSNTVTVFDLETLKVVETISIPGDNPDAILYEPKFKRVYCFNGRSGNVTVIDAVNLKVLANVALGGKPEVAVSDGAGHVLVNVEDSAELVVIDQAANEVQARWPLAPSRPLHQPYGRGPRCSPSTAIFRLRQPQDGDSRCTVGAASCNHGDRRRTGRGRI